MTGRERLVAAARGGETDRRAVIAYGSSRSTDSDSIIVAPRTVSQHAGSDLLVLAEVSSPFDPELLRRLDQDPEEGGQLLDQRVEYVKATIAEALADGADGIFYRLQGAHPQHTTPMQYGGHFLERDRDILAEIQEARLNVLFVVGGEETYFDFVSDLPAHVFAWDATHSGTSASAIRNLRNGAQASSDPDSEIFLDHSGENLALTLESQLLQQA